MSTFVYALQSILGVFNGLLLIINTVVLGLPVVAFGMIKLSSENEKWQSFWTPPLIFFSSIWAHVCLILEAIFIRTKFDIIYEGVELSPKESYLVICNHQSMADVPVLMKAVHGKIPFMRFFVKAQLKKLPIFGFAWRAADCPFMHRFSKEYLEANPHMKGKDLQQTIESCRRLRFRPVAITNFSEGTRFSKRKHEQQGGAYQHLLAPKAGGAALALIALEGKLKTCVDVTMCYHSDQHEIWDFLSGRVKRISMHVHSFIIPEHFARGDYQNDPVFRAEFQAWLNELWLAKDAQLAAFKASS